MKLEGKVAAITGGTAGLGRGIAEAFLAEGAKVALFARNPEKGARVIEEMRVNRSGPDRAMFVAGDVMNQSDVESFIDQAIEQFGTIDILVNNAGGAGDLQPLVNLSDEAFDEAMKWNVYSTFWATRRALPTMLEKGDGRIINISSMEGKHGKPVFTAYTAAKHAVNGITKSLAREVGAQGVTVNSICPGLVVTDIIKNNGPATAKAMGMEFDAMIDMFAQESAIKRPNTVEEIAAVALLLASKEGAGITGAQISVDGGTAQY
ncbi:SDR family NAD(P)-dependent oxidoreductase [Erythrobacter sp. JK5]|uniref:SDR family NAD(P)-dependent oxidoreductase n=1 Tax=Erythrobacter sp. JK5 TaxID=2829500 RepID=UPI001BAA8552|nr:SDR family NAD(P)-dependent oxidoreductase [Erythrobacter sp. JK5]QUL37412.1 SDR family oxidoreductase [Erythrobacter sp. JK5]